LTIPAAGVAMLLGVGGVMSSAGCTDASTGCAMPSETLFGVLFYGAPVIAALTVILTFRSRRGIWVAVTGLVLVLVDIAVLILSFR
jgi:hypothetical protein